MEADVPADLNSVLGERLQDNDKQEEIELYYELLSSGHSVGEILDSLGHIQRRSEHGHITTAEPPLSGVDGVPPEVTPGPALRGAAQANTRRTAGSIAPVEAESRRTEEPQATESAQLNELGSGDRGQFPDTTLPGSES